MQQLGARCFISIMQNSRKREREKENVVVCAVEEENVKVTYNNSTKQRTRLPEKFSLFFFAKEREEETARQHHNATISFRHHHARHINNKNGIRVAIIRVSRNERSDRVDEQQRYALNSHRAEVVSFTNSSSSSFFLWLRNFGGKRGLERETARARRCHRLRRGDRMRWFPTMHNAWILFRSRHREFVGRVGPFFARFGDDFFLPLWVRRVTTSRP